MDLNEILTELKSKLDTSSKSNKVKIVNLFAHNTSGKTRLSKLFQEKHKNAVLCYNAFLEDLFNWDNETFIFKIDKNSWLANLIITEGLDSKIINNFRKLTNSKLEPLFDIGNGSITFKNYTGSEGDKEAENIKISKGEESLFVWSIFYTILNLMIETFSEKEENRSTTFFNDIEYVIIDDPVSSLDDTRIITITLELIELLKKSAILLKKIKFLITTHHALFFNILYNNTNRTSNINAKHYILLKSGTNILSLKQQKDAPFSYHNFIVEEIRSAINENNIQKYHFNLFRALLEKTANFLGYNNGWGCLLDDGADKETFQGLLNHYSHSSLSEIESRHLSDEEKEAFKNTFNAFIAKFHWSDKNESI